jgi:hypothetical protein
MNYLMYAEVLEGAFWKVSTDLQKLKGEWSFTKRIFEVNDDLTEEEISNWERPRYPKAASVYALVYKEGELLHEKEIS